MGTDYFEAAERSPERSRPSWLSRLILPVLAFLIGAVAMAWVAANWNYAASLLGIMAETPPPAASAPVEVVPEGAEPVGSTKESEPERLVIDPEMSRRVQQLETRVSQIDNQARAAVGNADRAEGLLVAFAARRALDRGVGLGYIEGLLRQRFGRTQPQAVGTIITASRDPVTLQELQDGLQEVGPTLMAGGPSQSWWDALRGEMRDLIIVRKSGTPSPMPRERLMRATRRLESGDVDVALAEVLRMPGRDNAQAWIASARRYIAARRALDTIETAALLEPHTPAATKTPPSPDAAQAQEPAARSGAPNATPSTAKAD